MGRSALIPSYLPPGFLPLRAHAGAGGYSLTCPAYCLMHLVVLRSHSLTVGRSTEAVQGRVHEQVLVSPRRESQAGTRWSPKTTSSEKMPGLSLRTHQRHSGPVTHPFRPDGARVGWQSSCPAHLAPHLVSMPLPLPRSDRSLSCQASSLAQSGPAAAESVVPIPFRPCQMPSGTVLSWRICTQRSLQSHGTGGWPSSPCPDFDNVDQWQKIGHRTTAVK